MDADAIEQRQVNIGQRHGLVVLEMPAAPQARRGTARDKDWKVLVIVQAGIAHAAAVQIDGVIEERAVAIRSRLHPLEELRKQRHMEHVDLRDLRELYRIVTVMAR